MRTSSLCDPTQLLKLFFLFHFVKLMPCQTYPIKEDHCFPRLLIPSNFDQDGLTMGHPNHHRCLHSLLR